MVDAAVGGVGARRAGHRLGDDAVDAGGRLRRGSRPAPRPAASIARSAAGLSSGMSPPRKLSASSRPSTRSASVTVGSSAAAAVAGRPGLGAGALAARPSGGRGRRRRRCCRRRRRSRSCRSRGWSAACRCPRRSGTCGRPRSMPVTSGLLLLDQAGLGGGAAHVEATAAGRGRAVRRNRRRPARRRPGPLSIIRTGLRPAISAPITPPLRQHDQRPVGAPWPPRGRRRGRADRAR